MDSTKEGIHSDCIAIGPEFDIFLFKPFIAGNIRAKSLGMMG